MERLYERSFVIAVVTQAGFVFANTLIAHYARWIEFLGGGVRDVGWVMGAGAVGALVMRPWMGQWIIRLGARKSWGVGFVIFGLSLLGNVWIYDLSWPIYVLRSGLVLGAAMVLASSLTYASQIAPRRRRTEAIGILGVGGLFGMLFGPYLGDLLLAGHDRERVDFLFLFVGAAGVIVIPLLMLYWMRTPVAPQHHTQIRLREFSRTAVWYWPGTIVLVLATFGVCMTVPFGFLPIYVDAKHLAIPGMSEVGLFFWVYAGSALALRLLLRRVPDRFGRRKTLLAGLVCMSVGMFCFFLVEPDRPWLLIAPALGCGLGHGLMFHTMTALALESFPEQVHGAGSALSLMMIDIGMICGAPILGQIADVIDFEWMFATVGVLCFVTAIVYAWSSIPVWRERHATLT